MQNALRFLGAIALVLGIGPLAWAGFSVDQQPAEVPALAADPGDTYQQGLAFEVDDGDMPPGPPSLGMVVPPPGAAYDTDGISLNIPNDPVWPNAPGAPPGVLVSIDDGDPGPGVVGPPPPPDNATELFFSPMPPMGVSFPTQATELFLGLGADPPPIGLDDDVDAYEDRVILGGGAYFSPDAAAPAGLDPGDIFFSPLTGVPPVPMPPACDDVTGMWIAPNEATPVDVDALHLVPNAVCQSGLYAPPPFGTGPLCFLFSLDNIPLPPAMPPPAPVSDPGDIFITDCLNGFFLYADDVLGLGIVPPPDEFAVFDIDAISVPDVAPGVCEFDGDGFFDIACGGTDCDDQNPYTFPGALEICDGKDNDCDLVVPSDETDDDVPAGDGYVECSPWVGVPGLLGGDCDDTDPNVNPGAVEITAQGNCTDTIDNDCDGKIDSADPGCGGGTCAGTAAASIDGTAGTEERSILSLLAWLLIPVGAGSSLVVLRRKR